MAPVGQITNQQIVDIGMISLSNYSKLGTFSNKISNLEYILQYLYCMYTVQLYIVQCTRDQSGKEGVEFQQLK